MHRWLRIGTILTKGGCVFPATAISLAATPTSGLNCHVLVLNRHYMAIRVTSAKRAFSLLMVLVGMVQTGKLAAAPLVTIGT